MKITAAALFLVLCGTSVCQAHGPSPNFSPRDDEGSREQGQKKVVGYFPQWGIYSGYFVKNIITSGSAPILTQVNYAFANVQNNQCWSFDPWADYQVPFAATETVNGEADVDQPNTLLGNFHQFAELKKLFPHLKIIMSIGGASADPAAFSTAALPENRKAFVKSCVDMFIYGKFAPGLQQPGIFDGFDVDWEFPSSEADKTNFTALLAEFREQLDDVREGLSLSIAAPAGSWAYQFIELKKVARYLDYVGLMTYDYDGPWNFTTGFVAPLYRSLKDPDPANNGDASVQAYIEAGVPRRKIVFGVPFYGYQWSNVPNIDEGLFEPGNPAPGAAYNQIVGIEKNFQKHRDLITQEPWLYDGANFWTYDDPASIAFKMKYVQRQQLAGAMVWEVSNDLPDGKLLKTIAEGLSQENVDADEESDRQD